MVEMPHEFQEILRAQLPFLGDGDLDVTAELASLGLDSMGVVQLLASVEGHYDVELPDDILNEETFETVGSLWRTLSEFVLSTAEQAA